MGPLAGVTCFPTSIPIRIKGFVWEDSYGMGPGWLKFLTSLEGPEDISENPRDPGSPSENSNLPFVSEVMTYTPCSSLVTFLCDWIPVAWLPLLKKAGPLKYFIYTSTYHSLHHSNSVGFAGIRGWILRGVFVTMDVGWCGGFPSKDVTPGKKLVQCSHVRWRQAVFGTWGCPFVFFQLLRNFFLGGREKFQVVWI